MPTALRVHAAIDSTSGRRYEEVMSPTLDLPMSTHELSQPKITDVAWPSVESQPEE